MEVLLDLLVKKEQEIEALLNEIRYLNTVIQKYQRVFKKRNPIGYKLKGGSK